MDNLNCTDVTPEICRTFPTVERDCPNICGLCTCRDEKDCTNVTTDLCDTFPDIRQKCFRKCGICEDPKGLNQTFDYYYKNKGHKLFVDMLYGYMLLILTF